MVTKRAAADQPSGNPPAPTEAESRAADLQSQDPEATQRDADEAERAMRREEQIRQAAYEAWLRRGGSGEGGELDDWLEAERSIADKPPGQAGGSA